MAQQVGQQASRMGVEIALPKWEHLIPLAQTVPETTYWTYVKVSTKVIMARAKKATGVGDPLICNQT